MTHEAAWREEEHNKEFQRLMEWEIQSKATIDFFKGETAEYREEIARLKRANERVERELTGRREENMKLRHAIVEIEFLTRMPRNEEALLIQIKEAALKALDIDLTFPGAGGDKGCEPECRDAWNAAIDAAVERLQLWQAKESEGFVVRTEIVDAADHAWRLVNGLRTESSD